MALKPTSASDPMSPQPVGENCDHRADSAGGEVSVESTPIFARRTRTEPAHTGARERVRQSQLQATRLRAHQTAQITISTSPLTPAAVQNA
jgi:hypothetical protein